MAKNKRTFGGAIEKSILYNRNVLYFIFALALGYLFYMSTTYDYYSLSIFVIIGFLTSFFSKNMIVILSLAMAVSFIFKYGTKIRPEGFEDGNDAEKQPLDMNEDSYAESYSANANNEGSDANTNMNSGSNTNMNSGSNTNMNGGSNTNMNGGSNTNMNSGSNANMNSGSNSNMNSGSNSNMNGNNIGSANPLNSTTSMSPSTSTSKTTTGPLLSVSTPNNN